jgi:choice-of-anchor C domain-containing protein
MKRRHMLKLSKTRLLAFCAGILFAVAPANAGNLLVNGSFEDGNYSPVINDSYVQVFAGQTNITGWDVGGLLVDWHQNSFEIQNAENGTKMVDLNDNGGGLSDTGTLSQTFATSVGSNYDLTFYLAGPDTSFPNPRQVKVEIAGGTQIFSQAASDPLALVWGLETMSFTATSTSTTLTFSSVDGSGYWGPFLDNVSVNTVVPEPSTMAMYAGAFLVFGVRAVLKHARRAKAYPKELSVDVRPIVYTPVS